MFVLEGADENIPVRQGLVPTPAVGRVA